MPNENMGSEGKLKHSDAATTEVGTSTHVVDKDGQSLLRVPLASGEKLWQVRDHINRELRLRGMAKKVTKLFSAQGEDLDSDSEDSLCNDMLGNCNKIIADVDETPQSPRESWEASPVDLAPLSPPLSTPLSNDALTFSDQLYMLNNVTHMPTSPVLFMFPLPPYGGIPAQSCSAWPTAPEWGSDRSTLASTADEDEFTMLPSLAKDEFTALPRMSTVSRSQPPARNDIWAVGSWPAGINHKAQHNDDGSWDLSWLVDAGKLESTDKQITSPQFKVPLIKHDPEAAFVLMLHAKQSYLSKRGGSFKKARGKGKVSVKCQSDVVTDNAGLTFRIMVSSTDESKIQPARGPVQHNFFEQSVAELPKVSEEWDFSASVDDKTRKFIVSMKFQILQ